MVSAKIDSVHGAHGAEERRLATPARTMVENYWRVFLLGALVAALYAPVLKLLVMNWWSNPDYSHGFAVPPFIGYVLWRTRSQWQGLTSKPSNLGLVVMLSAIGLLIAGSLGAELFVSRVSLLLLLSGMVLYFGGWKMVHALAFPLTYPMVMVPLPAIIYNEVTFPLQLLASRLATTSLEVVQVPVLREGNLLVLPGYTMEVVEACSGIRSLMSLVALAVAYGYLVESCGWVRSVLVVLMFPIALVSNALRIVGAGALAYLLGPAWAKGFFHLLSGWLIFLSAVLCMLVAHWVLSRLTRQGEKSPNG